MTSNIRDSNDLDFRSVIEVNNKMKQLNNKMKQLNKGMIA